MKNITKLTSVALLTMGTASIASAQTVLIDFGNDSSFRGVSVTSPDTNGNTWNSVSTGAFFSNLSDTTGVATTIDLGFDSSGGALASDSFNGPAGGTDNPVSAADLIDAAAGINAVALGDFGIAEAVIDFVIADVDNVGDPGAGRFQIQGLTAGQSYKFDFYGSRKFTTFDTTRYEIFSEATYTSSIGLSDLVHDEGSGVANDDSIATITATAVGTILYFEFGGSNGINNGYINAMSISVVPEPGTYALLAGLTALVAIAMRRRRD